MDPNLAISMLRATVDRVPTGRPESALLDTFLRFETEAAGRSATCHDGTIDKGVAALAERVFGNACLGATLDATRDGRKRMALDLMEARPFQQDQPAAVQFAGYRIAMSLDDRGRIAEAMPLRAVASLSFNAGRGLFQEDGASLAPEGEKILRRACRQALVAADAIRARTSLLSSPFVTPNRSWAVSGWVH